MRKRKTTRPLAKDGPWEVPEGERPMNRQEKLVDKGTVVQNTVDGTERKLRRPLHAAEVHALLAKDPREAAETTIANIESVAEACIDRKLSAVDVQIFRLRLMDRIPILLAELRKYWLKEESERLIGALMEALKMLDQACASRAAEGREDGPAPFSLQGPGGLIEWWENVDRARRECERDCRYFRQNLERLPAQERQRALECIREIEQCIPLLRSHRLSRVREQYETIEKCQLRIAKLLVYAGEIGGLREYARAFFGPPRDESDGHDKIAAFAEAALGKECGGEDWLRRFDSLYAVWTNAHRLAFQQDNDGRLDSRGKIIEERAFVDPLYPDLENCEEPHEVVKASMDLVDHPNVHMEVENLDAAFKEAGLRPEQRKALMMRRNGKLMSRREVNAWKRSQRAIRGHRSKLVKAITEATKKRIITPPPISAGSFTGVVREGAGYSLPIPNEDKPIPKRRSPNDDALRFHSTPPPTAPTLRKRKHLFKKAST